MNLTGILKTYNLAYLLLICLLCKHNKICQNKSTSHYLFFFFFQHRDLAAFDKSRDQAIRTYQEHKASMHPVTAMLVGKDLKVD